jgi:hypothetical protein
MTLGGYRPNSGPLPGTKYRPRTNKKNVGPKVPKKRGRPRKVKVDGQDKPVNVEKVVVDVPSIPVPASVPIPAVVDPKPITPSPTSLLPDDIVVAASAKNQTPLEYLLSVMNDDKEDKNIRIRVAGMVAPFIHPKPGERTGKKDEKEEKAQTAFTGKFKAGRSPLSLVK